MKKWNHYFHFLCVCVKKMVRSVNRQYLIQLVEQCYIDQENNCLFFFVVIATANLLRNQKMLKKNFEKKKINTLNSEVVNWKVTYKNDPTALAIFSVHE